MTNTINDGGAAFPSPTVPIDRGIERLELEYGGDGMTLRDYFAAKAMNGICASVPTRDWDDDFIARNAYYIADAMLKAREEQP